jgi:hypothetical protein
MEHEENPSRQSKWTDGQSDSNTICWTCRNVNYTSSVLTSQWRTYKTPMDGFIK